MTYILYSVYKLFQSGIWIYFFQCKLIIKLFSDTTRPLQQIKKAYGNLGLLNYCCLNQILLPLYTMKAKWILSWKVKILYTCINLPLMNVCDIVHVNLQWWKRDRFRTERAEALHKAFFANIFKAHIFIWYKCSKGSWLVINNIN